MMHNPSLSIPAPWRIWHLELDGDEATLPQISGANALYVVFWFGGIPLGHTVVPAEHVPIPAATTAKLARAVITAYDSHQTDEAAQTGSFLDGLNPDNKMHDAQARSDWETLRWDLRNRAERLTLAAARRSGMTVSVVICTRDRPELLSRCLASICEQTFRPLETIVVDNAPQSDLTRRLVEQIQGVRYILEPRPGLDIAGNTGLRQSQGDAIAFIDDDVTAHPAWLKHLLRGFSSPNILAVTGLVLPLELETEAQLPFERYWSFNRGYEPIVFDGTFFEAKRKRGVPVWGIGAGANMALRREALHVIGEFEERLDVGAAGCSGDSEYWYRILAEGWCCRYEPTAVVYHQHRRTIESFNRQLFYYMRGHAAAFLIQFEKYRHWGNIFRLLLPLPLFYLRLA